MKGNNYRPCMWLNLNRAEGPSWSRAFFHSWVPMQDQNRHGHTVIYTKALIEREDGSTDLVPRSHIVFVDTQGRMAEFNWPDEEVIV